MLQIFQLYVFILAGFVGFIVIQRVPPLLHTPLMAATNAISAISLWEVATLVERGRLDVGTRLDRWLGHAADPRTVQVVLVQPYAPLLTVLAHPALAVVRTSSANTPLIC